MARVAREFGPTIAAVVREAAALACRVAELDARYGSQRMAPQIVRTIPDYQIAVARAEGAAAAVAAGLRQTMLGVAGVGMGSEDDAKVLAERLIAELATVLPAGRDSTP